MEQKREKHKVILTEERRAGSFPVIPWIRPKRCASSSVDIVKRVSAHIGLLTEKLVDMTIIGELSIIHSSAKYSVIHALTTEVSSWSVGGSELHYLLKRPFSRHNHIRSELLFFTLLRL